MGCILSETGEKYADFEMKGKKNLQQAPGYGSE